MDKKSENMDKNLRGQMRYFLKDSIRKAFDFSKTDQSRGVPPPPVEKPHPPGAEKVDLPVPEDWAATPSTPLARLILHRQSTRDYTGTPLRLEEISYLLWATQGIRRAAGPGHAYRTVPSAGCRHAFETYLAVFNVQGLEQGIFRYLPTSHQLLREPSPPDLPGKVVEATFYQSFASRGAATFFWTAIPYRMEWRYGLAAYKVIALDAGHLCQNLYLACQDIQAGTCAIAAYDQEAADALLQVDGEEEFVIYIAPVGKVV